MREFYLYIQSGCEVLNRKGRNLLAPCCCWLLWHPYSHFTIVITRSEKQTQYSRILKKLAEGRSEIFLQSYNFACYECVENLTLRWRNIFWVFKETKFESETRGTRKLHIEKLRHLHYSSSIISKTK
jgi:hypothetical protein